MRNVIALGVLVLLGCGAEVDPAGTPTPAPPVVAPTTTTAEAQSVVTVVGRLRAHDGGPLRAAEYTFTRDGFMTPAAKGALAEDGTFRVEVEPGNYVISVSAVDHAQLYQSLRIAGPVEVEGNLGTYARLEAGETIAVKSELLGADGEVIAPGPTSAARTAEGRYRLDLKDRPPPAVRLRYQLVGVGGRTFNGPLAEAYESDGGGDYWSIVTLDGRDAVELDLAALPPAGRVAQLTWTGESPELSALRKYRDPWTLRLGQLRERTRLVNGEIIGPGEEEKAAIAALAAEALAEIDGATSDDARLLLRLAHLDLFAGDDEAGALASAEWILEHVDPVDPRLGLFLNLDVVLHRALRTADEAFAARVEAWLARRQGNPDPQAAISAISALLHRADQRGDEARVAELYALTREPRFADMFTAKHLAERFDPERVLRRGRPLPDFEFPALGGDGRPITRAERVGRLFFIEFWATWCGPCVAELPEIHAAYAKVNGAHPGKGKDGLRRLTAVAQPKVEFVFVSLDRSPDNVQAFRAEHWSMPWTHAFVGLSGQEEVMARFGFSGVPTGVLVNGDSTILEVGSRLRGEELLPTLERALAEGPARSKTGDGGKP